MLPTPHSLLKLPIGAHEIGKCFLNRIIIIKSCNLMILVRATREPINSRTKQKHKPHSRLCSQLYYDGMSTYCSQAVLYRAKALSQPSFIFCREMGDLLKHVQIYIEMHYIRQKQLIQFSWTWKLIFGNLYSSSLRLEWGQSMTGGAALWGFLFPLSCYAFKS